MQKPEWGLYPDEFTPTLYWGARAIITKKKLDIPWDRQSFQTVDEACKEEFMDWLNGDMIPCLEKEIQADNTSHLEIASADGRFLCVAEDHNSGGYLYIGAYMR